jgi:hypothetical protein
MTCEAKGPGVQVVQQCVTTHARKLWLELWQRSRSAGCSAGATIQALVELVAGGRLRGQRPRSTGHTAARHHPGSVRARTRRSMHLQSAWPQPRVTSNQALVELAAEGHLCGQRSRSAGRTAACPHPGSGRAWTRRPRHMRAARLWPEVTLVAKSPGLQVARQHAPIQPSSRIKSVRVTPLMLRSNL